MPWARYKKNHPNATIKDYKRIVRQRARRSQGNRPAGPARMNSIMQALAPISQADIEAHANSLLSQIFGQQQQTLQSGYANAMSSLGASTPNAMGAGMTAANMLSGISGQIGAGYSQAIGQQTAADQALYSQLMGGASQVGGDIAAQLASAGLSPQGGVNVGMEGANAAGTLSAIDNAGITQLRQQGAAAQSYAAALPGLAMQQASADQAMFGAQTAGRMAELQAQQAQAMADLQGQRGSLMVDLINQAQGREFDKAVTRLTFRKDLKAMRQRTREANQAARQAALDRKAKAAAARADREFDIWKEQQANARNDADNMAALQRQREREAARLRAAKIEALNSRRKSSREAMIKRRQGAIGDASDLAKSLAAPRHDPNVDQFGDPTSGSHTVYGSHSTPRGPAARQLYAYFRQALPGAPDSWIRKQVKLLLSQYYGVPPRP